MIRALKRKISELIWFEIRKVEYFERILVNQGRILTNLQATKLSTTSSDLAMYEFSVFSQFGEDGIIQFLIQILEIKNKTFIEFGVEDFTESNCRFLMMKDNWRGYVIDGSAPNVERLRESYFYWKHQLSSQSAFINVENINSLLEKSGFDHDLGIMSIDLDGNDYFILSAVTDWRPRILICEFNPVFGPSRKITVPYDPSFKRYSRHHSGVYWGASLSALCSLAQQRGYVFVGINSAGHNAFFVRRDIFRPPLTETTPELAYTSPSFRDSRDQKGRLDFSDLSNRQQKIMGLPVLNIETNQIEMF